MADLVISQFGFLLHNVLQRRQQCGDVPLSSTEFAQKPVFDLMARDSKCIEESSIRGNNTQVVIENYNGLPNCFGHRLCIGSGFDGLHVSFIGVHQDYSRQPPPKSPELSRM